MAVCPHQWRLCAAFVLGMVLFSCARADESSWKAGVARVSITPEKPIVLLGYGDRTGPYTSVQAEIFASALALEDQQGSKGIIIRADLVGFQAATSQTVLDRIAERTGVPRESVMINASHSHTGPLVSLEPNLAAVSAAHPALTAEDARRTVDYTKSLHDKLVALAEEAVSKLQPAKLAWGQGRIGFPMNRRIVTSSGVSMGPNPNGIVDRVLPVMRVDSSDGKLLAVLFGVACHNTTMVGAENVIAGDYAGFAQAALDEKHPGSVAMFLSGCGADANPEPRGSMQLAQRHGADLAAAVERILAAEMAPVRGPLKIAYEKTDLPLESLTLADIERYTTINSTQALMARHMLTVVNRGQRLVTKYAAPIQVWQFGSDLTLVALPAEPVAEYAHLLRKALGPGKLWVAGYNNDCFGYLPSAQVAKEGGHEDIGITLWIWGESLGPNAGFFTEDVQDVVINTVSKLAKQAGRPTLQK